MKKEKKEEIMEIDDIDLEVCPCGNHTLIMGHCVVCGANGINITFNN